MSQSLRNQRGQGLIEYLIIVALMAVATIAIVRVMGQTVQAKFASISYALGGEEKSITPKIDANSYKKKDLGNFINGSGDRGSGSQEHGGE